MRSLMRTLRIPALFALAAAVFLLPLTGAAPAAPSASAPAVATITAHGGSPILFAANQRISVDAQNAAADGIAGEIGTSGFLDIYDGTQPTNPGTAITTQTLLVHIPLSSTAFAAASGGTAALNSVTPTAVSTSGTASWGTFTTNGGTRVIDFSVGTSSANLIVPTTTFTSGVTVDISSYALSVPMQGS